MWNQATVDDPENAPNSITLTPLDDDIKTTFEAQCTAKSCNLGN